MTVNHYLIAVAGTVGFLSGIVLTALVCTRSHARELRKLSTDCDAYLDNEIERLEAAHKLLTDFSLLTRQTKDALTENTKLLRILRNIVDPNALGNRVCRMKGNRNNATDEEP